MLIPMATLAAIQAGEVTLAFRRWDRARVKAGTKLRTAVGLVEVTSVEPVRLTAISVRDAHDAGYDSRKTLLDFLRSREGEIFRIGLRYAGADPRISLREQDALTAQETATILARLDAIDRSSRRDPWTLRFLGIIGERPGVRAPDLAESVGWETVVFKRSIRKLKELGLTESLDVGYRLSPRGRAIVAAAEDRAGGARDDAGTTG
jgi:hypothetical protein